MKVKFDKDHVIETTYDKSPMRKNTFEKTKVEKLDERTLSRLRHEKSRKIEEETGKRSFGREPSLTREETHQPVTREYKKLFNKGSVFESNGSINVLVGDNGCGKSSLVKHMIQENEDVKFLFVDLEKSNPKISTPDPEKGLTYSMQEVSNQFMWSVESHGETREGVLKSIFSLDLSEFGVLILDEPEQGLSLKNQAKYFKELEKLGIEVILITHSKLFIELSESVFDVETMKWVNSQGYLSDLY